MPYARRRTTGPDIPDSAPPDGANATSYTVRELENGTEYAFRVRGGDEDGGGIASNEASATPMDTIAPMLRSATTTALALGLTYDENLDASSEPAPSAFSVTVDGVSRAVTEVSVLGDTKVRLTLARKSHQGGRHGIRIHVKGNGIKTLPRTKERIPCTHSVIRPI